MKQGWKHATERPTNNERHEEHDEQLPDAHERVLNLPEQWLGRALANGTVR